MRILFPQEYLYPSQIGGPANTVYWHTGFLSRNGIDVSVITSAVGIPLTSSVKKDCWLVDGHRRTRYCSGGRVSLRILWHSFKELRACDIVHFSSLCYPWNIFICLIAVMMRKAVIISPRGELFPSAFQRKKRLKDVLFSCYRIFEKKITFHATSETERNAILNIFPNSNVVILPNFIETSYANLPNERCDDLLFLGRINCIKNIHILLEALVHSAGFMDSMGKLMIVGKARLDSELSYLEKLKRQVISLGLQDRVVFCGQKEGREKDALINRCKALILPSQSENFGNVVIEAMSQSVPVIASKGTPWGILNNKGIGWWVDASEKEIAHALDHLYSLTPDEYSEMCKRCRAFVEHEFDIYLSKKNTWIEIYKLIVPPKSI